MPFTETKIAGVWIHQPERHLDSRGSFEEQFKLSALQGQLDMDFHVVQVNQSESRAGVVRGIHWTTGTPGQAKYVSCVSGSIWDVVVDLRKGLPTFGTWFAETLSRENGKSVLISEGIGHAFLALEDKTVVNYLCSSEYNPMLDQAINPLDETLSIPFAKVASDYGIPELILSDKDLNGLQFLGL